MGAKGNSAHGTCAVSRLGTASASVLLSQAPRHRTPLKPLNEKRQTRWDFGVFAVGSGRTALYLILKALGTDIRRVLTPAFTCVAVPNAIESAGLAPVWVDVSGVNIDTRRVRELVEPTDAVLLQHTFGIPVDDCEPTRARILIEDRAHRFDGLEIVGDAAFFSLEHSKILSAGRGGLLWVKDGNLRAEIASLRELLPPAGSRRRAACPSNVGDSEDHRHNATTRGRAIDRAPLALRVPALSSPAHSISEQSTGVISPSRMHPICAQMAVLGLERLARGTRTPPTVGGHIRIDPRTAYSARRGGAGRRPNASPGGRCR